MAHFYGIVQGSRGEATRLGGKASGLRTVAASWAGSCVVEAYVDKNGVDCVTVRLRKWQGAGVERTIYDGPVGAYSPKIIVE